MSARAGYSGLVLAWLLALVAGSSDAQVTHGVTAAELGAILAQPLATPAAGSRQADVTVIEYFDYDCPVCRRIEPELNKLLAADPKVRLIRKDWPVFGEASAYAAYCSFAAAREGKYAAAHRALIGPGRDLDSKQDVQQVLREAGFDLTKLDADIALHQAEYSAALTRNQREAAELGLRGTPGLIVGDQLVAGGLDFPQLERLIARARQARSH